MNIVRMTTEPAQQKALESEGFFSWDAPGGPSGAGIAEFKRMSGNTIFNGREKTILYGILPQFPFGCGLIPETDPTNGLEITYLQAGVQHNIPELGNPSGSFTKVPIAGYTREQLGPWGLTLNPALSTLDPDQAYSFAINWPVSGSGGILELNRRIFLPPSTVLAEDPLNVIDSPPTLYQAAGVVGRFSYVIILGTTSPYV